MKKWFCLLLLSALLCSTSMAEAGLTDFATTDMEGHEVSQEIFADYDLTLVNVWATWCGYCIEEMPAFSQLTTMLPDNVNFITICTDASTDMELAKEILRSSGANFQTLVADEVLEQLLLEQVYAYPTTFFLKSDGTPAADPIVGAPGQADAASAYYSLAMGVLRLMEEAA